MLWCRVAEEKLGLTEKYSEEEPSPSKAQERLRIEWIRISTHFFVVADFRNKMLSFRKLFTKGIHPNEKDGLSIIRQFLVISYGKKPHNEKAQPDIISSLLLLDYCVNAKVVSPSFHRNERVRLHA